MTRRGVGEGSIHKRQDGRWAAYAALPSGKRRYFYAKTRHEVADQLKIFNRRLASGLDVTNDKRTLAEYLTWWLEDQRSQLAAETWRGYESKIRMHLIPELGNVKLIKLRPLHVREFVAARSRDPRYSSRHINNIYDVLHTALQDAMRLELVDRNVASLVETPQIDSKKKTALTADQAVRLLSTLQGDPLEPLFRTLVTLGLRPGEALGLQWKSVDLPAQTLHVESTLQRHDGKWVIKPKPKNKSSEQTLPIPRFCIQALEHRRAEQGQDKIDAGDEWQEWGLVFTRSNGAPIWFSDANRHLAKVCKRAGVPKVTMHELRHSAPSILLALGVDQRVIMRVLRHSTIVLTANLYTHVVDPLVKDAMDRIDTAFTKAESNTGAVNSHEGVNEGVKSPQQEAQPGAAAPAQSPDQDI
jgi:integrase